MRAVRRAVVDDAGLEVWSEPWDGLVRERREADGTFAAEAGPFRRYRRTVEVEPAEGGHLVTSTVDFDLAIPYFGWLLALPVLWALKVPGAPRPWWGPADLLDARAATVLGSLCAASLVAGYIGTSITQTITYAADDFGIETDTPQTVALAVVRIAVVLAIGFVALADRRGRRIVLLGTAAGACVLGATTALAPSLPWFTLSQTLTRGCSTALAVLIAVLAAEEMPKGARAFGASVLGMSAALGAGFCVMGLTGADALWTLETGGWRILFVVPLVALPLLAHLRRHLPESRRFTAEHADAPVVAGHHQRLILLGLSYFLIQLFITPASQLQNEFLRDERGFTPVAITLFTICTSTPAGIGVVAAGKLADVHGRRLIGTIGIVGGVGLTVLTFLSHGVAMWVWSIAGSIIGGATIPALGVYGPELFPTASRARANAMLIVPSQAGAVIGLLLAGVLSDRFGALDKALPILAIGPLLLAVLVVTRYPETAQLELEEINPEDRPATT